MKNMTELVIIIDRSGSMGSLVDDVIGGYNALIEEQKRKKEKISVTTILFNTATTFINENEDINNVKELTRKNYVPSGCTALLDAIGDGIALVKSKHAKTKEDNLPKNTIFSIMTDGLENSSREYSYATIKNMIQMQEKCGWKFIFQAANIDTMKEAEKLGVSKEYAMSFEANSAGVRRQFKKACSIIENIKK